MSPFDLFSPWPALIVALGVGRVVLSLLPPGRPGGHFTRDLPSTWAASHVLGLLALDAQARWCALTGVELPAWGHLLPWAVIGAARVALLPGRVVPRHEPPEPSTERLCWIARGALLIAVVTHGLRAGVPQASHLAAGGLLLLEGARCLRCAPTSRAWVAAIFACTLVAWRAEVGPELGLVAAAAAGGVSWTRRADARGLALAAACLASLGWALGLAGGLVLVLVSAAPSVKRTAVAVAGALVLITASFPWEQAGAMSEASLPSVVSAVWLLGLVGPARSRELLWLVGFGGALLLAPWNIQVGIQLAMPVGALGLCVKLNSEPGR